MDRANSESEHDQDLASEWRRDHDSALMEWKILNDEERHAILTGEHHRAGRLDRLKTRLDPS